MFSQLALLIPRHWDLLSFVTLLTLFLYFILVANVGIARFKFGVSAPAMTGNAAFERYVRVHYNTLEQLVVFLPAMWLFAYYVDVELAACLGLLWCLGRIIYAFGYYKEAGKRHLGSILTFLPTMILIIWTLVVLMLRAFGNWAY